jgi:hypothetical protein
LVCNLVNCPKDVSLSVQNVDVGAGMLDVVLSNSNTHIYVLY